MAAIKFEKALSRLETIVTELEAGELSLDDSLKIFEEGVKLSKTWMTPNAKWKFWYRIRMVENAFRRFP
jgi:exodeoxyribonuclease VII small subunit